MANLISKPDIMRMQNPKAKAKVKPAIIDYEKEKKGIATVYALISFALFIGIWQISTAVFPNFGKVFPGPFEVVKAFIESFYKPIGTYTLIPHTMFTLSRIMVGFVVGGFFGNLAGLAMGSSKFANAIIRPLFEVFRPIPAIAWIPMAILWFGVGEISKYFIVTFGCFVITALNAYAGAARTSPMLKGAARMLGADEKQVFYKIVLPSSIPQIFSGLQISMSSACSTILAAEMVRSQEGAGWIIIRGMDTGNMTQIWVGILAISISGFILVTILRLIERKAIAWNFRGR